MPPYNVTEPDEIKQLLDRQVHQRKTTIMWVNSSSSVCALLFYYTGPGDSDC